ncbi:MAG: hypothetical protein ACLQU3_24000 [Limisphaerales bacterium]
MANSDQRLRVPIPHDYMLSYAVQTSVNAECERLSKELTEFRGYVVSRGFDIEKLLAEIITHLLYINRPRYTNETDDEFRFQLQCRGFFRNDFLVDQKFGFRRKIEFARKILTWLPKKLKDGIDLPNPLLDEAANWRNCFAHDLIEFTPAADNSLLATLKKRRGPETIDVPLTQDQLKIVTEALEKCHAALSALEYKLSSRYGDARPQPAQGTGSTD